MHSARQQWQVQNASTSTREAVRWAYLAADFGLLLTLFGMRAGLLDARAGLLLRGGIGVSPNTAAKAPLD